MTRVNTTPRECRKYFKCTRELRSNWVDFQFGRRQFDVHHRALRLSGILRRSRLHPITHNDLQRQWNAHDQLRGTLHHGAHEEWLNLRENSYVGRRPNGRLAKSRFRNRSWRYHTAGSKQHPTGKREHFPLSLSLTVSLSMTNFF